MRTPHVRAFFCARRKTVAYQHFRRPKCAPSHTFFGIGAFLPSAANAKRGKLVPKTMHFEILPEFRDHGHRSPITYLCRNRRKANFRARNIGNHNAKTASTPEKRQSTIVSHRKSVHLVPHEGKRKALISASCHATICPKKQRADVIGAAL